MPKYLQEALVATEDRRFYSHHGVDMRGLIRSAINTASGDTQGGSTLTMQYVKQIRYYQAGDAEKQAAIAQNLNRKIEDAKCALYIERHESKAQILDNYLNIAFFGENSYGIQTAAQTYFNKPASQLTLARVGDARRPAARAAAVRPVHQPRGGAAAARRGAPEPGRRRRPHPGPGGQVQGHAGVAGHQTAPPVRQGCANANANVANVGFFCDYVANWLDHEVAHRDPAADRRPSRSSRRWTRTCRTQPSAGYRRRCRRSRR